MRQAVKFENNKWVASYNDKLSDKDLKNLSRIEKWATHDTNNVHKPLPKKNMGNPKPSLPKQLDQFMTDEDWWDSKGYRDIKYKTSKHRRENDSTK